MHASVGLLSSARGVLPLHVQWGVSYLHKSGQLHALPHFRQLVYVAR